MSLHNSTKGFVSTNTLMGLVGAGVLSLIWWFSVDEDTPGDEIQPLFEVVIASEFKLEFIEPGEIESAENIEIKSEVRSSSSAGVSILEIVPEGSVVKKNDFLVRLDDASLQKDLLEAENIRTSSESHAGEGNCRCGGSQACFAGISFWILS